MDEKDIQVSLDDGLLTIRARRSRNWRRRTTPWSKRSYGQFQRVIPVPASVDKEKVKAAFKKGVLTSPIFQGARTEGEEEPIEITAE